MLRRGNVLLRAGKRVQIEVDPQAVLPRPLDRLEHIWQSRRSDLGQSLKSHGRKREDQERSWDSHSHATFSRNGSPGQVSIAQNGNGKRIQFNPAAAISAKS